VDHPPFVLVVKQHLGCCGFCSNDEMEIAICELLGILISAAKECVNSYQGAAHT
jgi:hypothetical protein